MKSLIQASRQPLTQAILFSQIQHSGQVNAMILSFGRNLSSAYVWLAADAATLTQAKLVYRLAGRRMERVG